MRKGRQLSLLGIGTGIVLAAASIFGLVRWRTPTPAQDRGQIDSIGTDMSGAAISNAAKAAIGSEATIAAHPEISRRDETGVAVLFNGREYRSDTNAAARLVSAQRSLGTNETLPALVGLAGIPDSSERGRLRAAGLDLLAYVADRGWIARLHAGAIGDQWSSDNVRLFEPLDHAMRMTAGAMAPCDCDLIPLRVHLLPDCNPDDCIARFQMSGVEVSAHRAGDFSYIAARAEKTALAGFVDRVARDADVLLVERGGGARLLNDNSMRILQSGSYTGATPVFARGIYGSNQVIAVCDTGLDADSCYFRDASGTWPPTNRVDGTNVNLSLRKVIAADFLYAGDDPADPLAWDNHSHGTHVCGDASGSSLADPLGTFSLNGMAPAAKLIIQDAGFVAFDPCADLIGLGCPVTNFAPALRQAYAQGARLHNNSWGDYEDGPITNRSSYSQVSRDLDVLAWEHRDFLIVCAAGNDGVNDTVLSPSNAKNGLSVAATGGGASADSIASFSSRGWAADGRVKPDLAAPGNGIFASTSDASMTTSNCTTGGGGGTSYASPLACGLAALVRDYFAQGYNPSRQPVASNAFPFISSALVKAMLLNSCRSMSGVGPAPSREQGWGRPNLGLAFAFTNTPHSLFVADVPPRFSATPAQPFTAYLNVRTTNTPLRIVLAWTDYPGTPGAGKQLVNDLDLIVKTPSATYRGNGLSNDQSVATEIFDRTNNVELVHLSSAPTGIVEISVWAFAVPQATQAFAIVASGDIEEIPKTRDDDADGLPDYWELWRHGNLAAAAATNDLDADGVNELAECIAGTDPTNSASLLGIQNIATDSNGMVNVSFPAVAGRAYSISAGEEPQSLLPFGSFVAGVPETNFVFTFADTNASATRIYSIRAAAP